jgi:Fe-S-cluster-containing hydrogenase component 2
MAEILDHPLLSLEQKKWFKLICGASFQDLSVIKSLALIYSLAGADCIDIAADLSVIEIVRSSLNLLKNSIRHSERNLGWKIPWLMVSINDGEDIHFRKASFDPQICPTECPKPCEKICPVEAINKNGVLQDKCYGCGRCIPLCPLGIIESIPNPPANAELICEQLVKGNIQAIEIHTQVGHLELFAELWTRIRPYQSALRLLAISCQDHPNAVDYLKKIYDLISPLECPLLWQTDGRPMSGDIGKGTTHATIAYAQKLLNSQLPGYIQLAGGTNNYTVEKLEMLNLRNQISGVAYGSYARSILSPMLLRLELNSSKEDIPESIWQAVNIAHQLVAKIKQSSPAN